MSERLLIVGDKVLITEDSLLTVPVDTNLQDKTVTPAINSQVVTPDAGYLGLNKVTVEAMPTATQATPSIEVDNTGLVTASATQDAGYVAAGTKSATEQLPVQEAQTITPGTTDKTIEAGKYLTGIQTVKGDANLVSENIAKDIVIFGVTGTHQSSEDVTAELTEQDELIEQISLVLEGKAAAGAEKPFAIIGVTYPEGSTCTCSKDEIVLALENTNGKDFFSIPEAGTWIITSTDGTNIKSQSMDIIEEGQFESVELSYAMWYYKNGTEHISMEPIKDSIDNSVYGSISEDAAFVSMSTGTFNICLGEISSASVDLSKINTLKCKISDINCTGDKNVTGLRISVCSSKTAYNTGNRTDAAVANYISKNLNADTEYSLDVRDVSSGYIGVYAYGSFSPAGSAAFNLLQFWGE